MLTAFLGLLLAVSPTNETTIHQFQVTLYRGNPDDSNEVISRPQFVTRDNQQALISIGQQVPIVSDIKKEVGRKIVTISDVQTGTMLKLLPKAQQDGSVFVKGSLNMTEAVSESSTLERRLTFHELFQPGEMRVVKFYHADSQKTQTNAADGTREMKTRYTGNEHWMEITLVSPKARPEALQPQALPLPARP